MIRLKRLFLPAALLLTGFNGLAQTPFSKSLAEFDKLASQLRASAVVGDPIRAGETAVIPFAAFKFGLASGDAKIAQGGAMSAKNTPLGFVIVDGDDVRVELLPEPEEQPSILKQLVTAIVERKVVIMGNGLNVGGVSGSVQDLAPLISALAPILSGYQTSIIGNALNLGNLKRPDRSPDPAEPKSKSPQDPNGN